MKKNTKVMIGALVVVAAIAYLFVSGFTGNTSIHVNLKDLVANPTAYDGKYIQTEGKLVNGSTSWDSKKIELRFLVSDGEAKLPVLWKDIKPDNFSGDVIVNISGRYKAGQEFLVDTLLTKCPSKYEGTKKDFK